MGSPKKVLVTAGPVYGRLDDNKLVANRSRGIWAAKFAAYLWRYQHEVVLLLPDILPVEKLLSPATREGAGIGQDGFEVIYHKGFEEYYETCLDLANSVDAVVMAAAVVNWIPANPVKGKMSTHGYKVGDVIDIPFKLAPRVIDEMRTTRCKCVIGCKMLSGASYEELHDAAHGIALRARCNVVVANDLSNLKTKYLVFPDRTALPLTNAWDEFYLQLRMIIEDIHYRTNVGGLRVEGEIDPNEIVRAKAEFDQIVLKYQSRFLSRRYKMLFQSGEPVEHTFGAIAVHVMNDIWLCTPRKKGPLFTSSDAVLVKIHEGSRTVLTDVGKATLNAPHMVGMGEGHKASAVLHLHEQLEGVDTLPYTPPGTARDSEQAVWGVEGLPRVYNVQGHGFIACLDKDHEIIMDDYRVGRE